MSFESKHQTFLKRTAKKILNDAEYTHYVLNLLVDAKDSDLLNAIADVPKDSGLDCWQSYHPTSESLAFISSKIKDVIYNLQYEALHNFEYYLEELLSNFPEMESLIETEGRDKGLLLINDSFEPHEQSFKCSNFAFYIAETRHLTTNSTLQLSEAMLCQLKKGNEVSIRPNCFRKVPGSSCSVRMEHADWYGKPFEFDWVNDLSKDEIAENVPNYTGFLSDGDCTQFYWSLNKDDTVELAIEELPYKLDGEIPDHLNSIDVRFLHGVYRKDSKGFEHLDGAIHSYTPEEYKIRVDNNLKDKNKNYDLMKIFKVNGHINQEDFRGIIGSFYKWNWMPIEYFGEDNHS